MPLTASSDGARVVRRAHMFVPRKSADVHEWPIDVGDTPIEVHFRNDVLTVMGIPISLSYGNMHMHLALAPFANFVAGARALAWLL